MTKKKASKRAIYETNRELHAAGMAYYETVLREKVKGDAEAELALDYLVSTVGKLKPRVEQAYESKIGNAEGIRKHRAMIDLARKMMQSPLNTRDDIRDAIRQNAKTSDDAEDLTDKQINRILTDNDVFPRARRIKT